MASTGEQLAAAVASILAAAKSIDQRGKGKAVLAADWTAIHAARAVIGSLDVSAAIIAGTRLNVPLPPVVSVPPAAPDVSVPTVPRGLSATVVSTTQIDLSWYGATDPVVGAATTSGIKEYLVYVNGVLTQTVPAPTPGLTTTLAAQNLGTPSVGTETQNGTDWSITSDGAGFVDIADSGRLVSGEVSADGCLYATVESVTTTPAGEQAGIILRNGTAANAETVSLIAHPTYVTFNRRPQAGQQQLLAQLNGITLPCSLFLQVEGSVVKAFYSQDGNNPQPFPDVAQVTSTLPTAKRAGLLVASKTPGSPITGLFSNVGFQAAAKVTTSLTGLTEGTSYAITVKARDVALNLSAATASLSATTASSAVSGIFPLPVVSYVTPVPAGSGHGMDTPGGSGRHLITPATTVYLVGLSSTFNTPTTVATRTVRCRLSHYLQAAGPKVGIPVEAGMEPFPGSIPNQGSRYNTFAGQVASGQGYHMAFPINWWASDQVLMHRSTYVDPSCIPAGYDQLDGVQLGGFEQYSGSKIVDAYGETFGSYDECSQSFGISNDITEFRCLTSMPYNNSGRPGDPHGYTRILSDEHARHAVIQCIDQHASSRLPFYSRAKSFAYLNSLAFNPGVSTGLNYFEAALMDPAGTVGFYPSYNAGATVPSYHDIEQCLIVTGPSSNATVPLIIIGGAGVPFPAGSKMHINGWRTRGTVGAISYRSSVPSDFLSATQLSAAYPTGTNLYTITDTLAGHKAFAQGLADIVGARSKSRVGWAVTAPYHCVNYLNGQTGISNVGRVIDSPSENGGIPTITASGPVDVFAAGAFGGDPMPTVEQGRDQVQPSGLTKLEEWLKRRHYDVANA